MEDPAADSVLLALCARLAERKCDAVDLFPDVRACGGRCSSVGTLRAALKQRVGLEFTSEDFRILILRLLEVDSGLRRPDPDRDVSPKSRRIWALEDVEDGAIVMMHCFERARKQAERKSLNSGASVSGHWSVLPGVSARKFTTASAVPVEALAADASSLAGLEIASIPPPCAVGDQRVEEAGAAKIAEGAEGVHDDDQLQCAFGVVRRQAEPRSAAGTGCGERARSRPPATDWSHRNTSAHAPRVAWCVANAGPVGTAMASVVGSGSLLDASVVRPRHFGASPCCTSPMLDKTHPHAHNILPLDRFCAQPTTLPAGMSKTKDSCRAALRGISKTCGFMRARPGHRVHKYIGAPMTQSTVPGVLFKKDCLTTRGFEDMFEGSFGIPSSYWGK